MNVNPHKNTVSLCMIVKNEEEHLRDCLDSVHDLVDQIVVIDTGSTDKTIEIAREFGAEVHDFQWCDDFSAARNESIKYAKCKWILWVDADERLRPDTKKSFKKCLRNFPQPILYTVSIRSITDKGKNYHDSDAHRLFMRHPKIKFEGVIHEQIAFSAKKAGAKELHSGIVLEHLGYDLDEDQLNKKLKRNQPLLEKMIATDANNAYANFWLAQNLSQQGKPRQALKYMDKSLLLNQFSASFRASALNITAQLYTRIDEWQNAVKYAEMSLKLFTMQFGAHYILYLAADQGGKTADAIKNLEILIKNTKYLMVHPKQISTDTLASVPDLLGVLAREYYKAGDHQRALKKFLEAREIAGDDRHLKEIVAIAQEKNDLMVLRETLSESISMGNESPEVLDTLGITQIKLQQFGAALEIYQGLMRSHPDNPYVTKRAASLYAKLGNREKAEELLTNIVHHA